MRRLVAAILGTLAAVTFAFTLMAWDSMNSEEQLAHEIGDDTKVFAAAVLVFGVASLLLGVTSLVLWHWPRVKEQWSAERRLLRDSRSR